MSKYKKPKVGFLDHVAGKKGTESNPIDDVLNEAKENPAPQPEPKVEKKPVITEEKKSSEDGMSSYVKATKVDPKSAKGSFDDKAVEGYVPPILEEKKPDPVNPEKMTAYQKAVHERSVKEKQKMQEAADLLGGEPEKAVTQADLKQIKVALASLGGGGLGKNDVIALIQEYAGDSVGGSLTPEQIQEIIDAIDPLDDTDALPEGTGNLYYTEERFDASFSTKTTNQLPEGTDGSATFGVNNQYFTAERARASIQSIDSAIVFDQATGNISINSTHPDFDQDFDSDWNSKTTDDLPEGSTNLYYRDDRVEALVDSAYVNARVDLPEGIDSDFVLTVIDSDYIVTIVDSDYINARVETQVLENTDSLAEGVTNLYYTDSRARSAISSGDSYIQYDNATGEITFDASVIPEGYTSEDFDSDFLAKNTDSLTEGANNLYYTTARFDSDASDIRSRLDSLDDRVDSDDIEIQTLKNRVDELDVNSAIVVEWDLILSYDSSSDSVPRGQYGVHYDGTGTDYVDVDKFYFNNYDRNEVFVPFAGVVDSGDIIVVGDSDGGVARYQVTGLTDNGNHFRIDVTALLGNGAPADILSAKIYPATDNTSLATLEYVDAQDKILQDQINALDSADDSEHAWNVSEHAKLDSDISNLSSLVDSEHAWNIAEHEKEITARQEADSDLNARLDSEHAWNVAEHDASDSDINARLDSEHAWNVSEHDGLQSRLDSEHSWNILEHNQLQSNIDSVLAIAQDHYEFDSSPVQGMIDSTLENASLTVDSDLFVSTSGDQMTGQLSISRDTETGVGLRIKNDDQTRITLRTDGKFNWTADASNATLNKDDGDLNFTVNDEVFIKLDQSAGEVDVNQTLTLTGSEKRINLPQNSDVGELASNNDRRLYWDQNNVGIDVELNLNGFIQLPQATAWKMRSRNASGSLRTLLALDADGETFHVYNLATPTSGSHGANKAYVDSELGNYVPLTGIAKGDTDNFMKGSIRSNKGVGYVWYEKDGPGYADTDRVAQLWNASNNLQIDAQNGHKVQIVAADGSGSKTFLTAQNTNNSGTAGVDYKMHLYHVAEPSNPQDAATKHYVDTEIASISGAPVGSIQLWMGGAAPSGYFNLRGSTFNTSTYPLLHQYFVDNFPDYVSGTLPDYRGYFPGAHGGDHLTVMGRKYAWKTGLPSSATYTGQGGSHNHQTFMYRNKDNGSANTGPSQNYMSGTHKNTSNSNVTSTTAPSHHHGLVGFDTLTSPKAFAINFIIRHD